MQHSEKAPVCTAVVFIFLTIPIHLHILETTAVVALTLTLTPTLAPFRLIPMLNRGSIAILLHHTYIQVRARRGVRPCDRLAVSVDELH